MRSIAGLLTAVLLVAGCADDDTKVVVNFGIDTALSGSASVLQIQVFDDRGTLVYDRTRPDDTHPATLQLPASVHVVPQDGRQSADFRVEATLRDATGAVLGEQRARSRAIPGQQRELWLCFQDDCRSVSCADDQRCLEGACVGMQMDALPVGQIDGRALCGAPISIDAGPLPDAAAGEPAAEFSDIRGGIGRADGVEAVTITVALRDDLNRPVAGVTPQLGATGAELTLEQSCPPTDATGISVCDAALRSTSVQTAALEIVAPITKGGGIATFETPWIYRSVGPGSSSPLADGGDGAVSVADSIGTFPAPLPARVGVGDVLLYDSIGDDVFDSLAFVHARASATELSLRNADGLATTATSAPTGRWALYRAYASLSAADQGIENAAIDASLSDFDTWDTGEDLVARQRVWNIACYGDGVDTGRVRLDSWVTSPSSYLRIYTPQEAAEVGESQRHNGVWSDSAYRLEIALSGEYAQSVGTRVDYLRIDGIQLRVTGTGSIETGGIAVGHGVSDNTDIRISNNLIVGALDAGTGSAAGIWIADITSTTTIWNNIVSTFRHGGNSAGIRVRGFSACVSHNTVFDSLNGFVGIADGPMFLRNNIALGNGNSDYNSAFAPESHHNASSDGSAPGIDPIMLSSSDPSDYFRSATDFRIEAGAAFASELIDTGGDNADDPCSLPLEAIDGAPRVQGAGPDLGADESTP